MRKNDNEKKNNSLNLDKKTTAPLIFNTVKITKIDINTNYYYLF